MLQSVGHPVERLVRMAIGDLELGDLAPGQWREENFSRFGVADQG
jgi:16S rRNA U516 pseudouridylate synthase RsuA-like enzyme